jgi:hypothetical protein
MISTHARSRLVLSSLALFVCSLVANARGDSGRPPGVPAGPVVARVHLRSGISSRIRVDSVEFPAETGTALTPNDEISTPPGEFLILSLTNGYLVRIDEDLSLRVRDIVLLGAPPARESFAAQLDRLVTREERAQTERIAGSQARRSAADAVPAQSPAPPKFPRGSAPRPPTPAPPPPSETSSSNSGGLGLSGIGQGGGGSGQGIGLGGLGTIGHGAGSGSGQGYGAGSGRLGGAPRTNPPHVVFGPPTVTGSLPAEIVRRIIRQQTNRVRYCYEQALGRNPALAGTVSVRLVVSRNGTVTSATDAGSQLPDATALNCVVNGLRSLHFPAPSDPAEVLVTQTIALTPADGPPSSATSSPALPRLGEVSACLHRELSHLPLQLGRITVRVRIAAGRIVRVALGGGLPTPACARELLIGQALQGTEGTWIGNDVPLH